jgi:hypothetical protein
MSCCGQKRSSFVVRPPAPRATAAPTPAATRPAAAAAPVSGAMVALRSVSAGGMIVRGPASGRQYAFSAVAPVQMVEARDAAALLRTSWFRQA